MNSIAKLVYINPVLFFLWEYNASIHGAVDSNATATVVSDSLENKNEIVIEVERRRIIRWRITNGFAYANWIARIGIHYLWENS